MSSEQSPAPTRHSSSISPPSTTPDAGPEPTGRRAWYRDLVRHPFVLIPPLFYLLTVGPTIGLGDTALLLDEIERLKINTHVNNHNLTVVLGWLFARLPIGEVPLRGNLASAFAGALTIILFYVLIYRDSRSRWTAAVASLVLMVSHSMWWHSTIVECYALNGLFTVLALLALQSIAAAERDGRTPGRSLGALFFLAGLSVFNHVQMGIIALAATTILVWHMVGAVWTGGGRAGGWWRALRLALLATGCFLIGFLPYLLTFLRDMQASGSFQTTLQAATVGKFASIMLKSSPGYAVRDLAYLIFKQFPSPALLLLPAGLVILTRRWWRRAALAGLAVMLFINAGFFMSYNTWDKFAFLLPTFILLAYAAAHAIDLVHRRLAARPRPVLLAAYALLLAASSLWPIYFYGQLSVWGRQPGPWHLRYNNDYTRNSHDTAEYIANPDKHDYFDVEEFAELIFTRLPEAAYYIDDDSRTYYPIHYFKTHGGRRPDLNLRIINSWGFSGWGLSSRQFTTLLGHAYRNDRPLFVITIDRPFNAFITAAQPPGVSYRFEEFPLDARRWIYRLRTAAEMGESMRAAPFIPVIQVLHTGLDFNTHRPLIRNRFREPDAIMVAMDFELSADTFPLGFTWFDPAGRVYHVAEESIVPLANTRAWSFLHKSTPLARGEWRVVATIDADTVAATSFVIE